jgi:quercetin dioxygenase-like cupin family protein
MSKIRIRAIPVHLAPLLLGLVWATQPLAEPPAAVGATPVATEVLAKSGASWNGDRLPAYPRGAPEITVLKIAIPPGARLPLHKHPVINAAYMLRGRLTVTTEDQKSIELKAGQAMVEVVDTWHYGRNEGPEPVEILVFYAGTPDAPIAVKH